MRLNQITPFVPCTDLQAQIVFYRDTLGFHVGFEAAGHAYMSRDAAAVRLVEVSDHVDLTHPEREGSFYIDVDGGDALYQAMKPALDASPEGCVRTPFDQPYGQREMHIPNEDCTLVFFGEAIQKP